jgi:hypothetical protein
MAEDVRFPVYALAKDCGEFTEYRSLEDMRAYLEAVDVEGNEYDAWDVDGFVAKLTTANSRREWLCLERSDVRMSDGQQQNEVKSKAVPYVNGRRLRANG